MSCHGHRDDTHGNGRAQIRLQCRRYAESARVLWPWVRFLAILLCGVPCATPVLGRLDAPEGRPREGRGRPSGGDEVRLSWLARAVVGVLLFTACSGNASPSAGGPAAGSPSASGGGGAASGSPAAGGGSLSDLP